MNHPTDEPRDPDGRSTSVSRETCFPPPDRSELPALLRQITETVPLPNDDGLLNIAEPELARGLSDRSGAALSRIFRTLACGEESAIHVFYNEGDRLGSLGNGLIHSQRLMYQIAKEEELHDTLLRRALRQLPMPSDAEGIRRKARGFYMRTASRNPATHFFRISELDSAVCILVSSILEAQNELPKVGALREVLSRIRHDETRHVLASRRHAAMLNLSAAARIDEADPIRARLIGLLELVADSFEEVGVDPARIFGKIRHRPAL